MDHSSQNLHNYVLIETDGCKIEKGMKCRCGERNSKKKIYILVWLKIENVMSLKMSSHHTLFAKGIYPSCCTFCTHTVPLHIKM